jgi:hypothetical protein
MSADPGTGAPDEPFAQEPPSDAGAAGQRGGNGAAPNGKPGASAFDRAKAAMQPYVNAFAEGEFDEASLLAKADEIAASCSVRKNDLRKWVKLEMDRLRPQGPGSEPNDQPKIAMLADPPIAPSPEPLAVALDQIVRVIRERIVCEGAVVWGVALWIAATWGVRGPDDPSGPDVFPRLVVQSATKRCGKSLLLETVAYLCPSPLSVENVTPAAIFRVTEETRPTWIVDEADRFLKKNDELIGLVNSGHRRRGAVIRLVEVTGRGDKGQKTRTFEARSFSTFAPMGIAGIGGLVDTVEDRANRVVLKRQPAPRARSKRIGLAKLRQVREIIGSQLHAHGDAMAAAMAAAPNDADFPAWLNDRDADNWQPLIAVANLAGGDWPGRAQEAMRALCEGQEQAAEQPPGERLLNDIYSYVQECRREAVQKYLAWRGAPQAPAPSAAPFPGSFVATGAACRTALAAAGMSPTDAVQSPYKAVSVLIAAGMTAADAGLALFAMAAFPPATPPRPGSRPAPYTFIKSDDLAERDGEAAAPIRHQTQATVAGSRSGAGIPGQPVPSDLAELRDRPFTSSLIRKSCIAPTQTQTGSGGRDDGPKPAEIRHFFHPDPPRWSRQSQEGSGWQKTQAFQWFKCRHPDLPTHIGKTVGGHALYAPRVRRGYRNNLRKQ